MARRGTPLPWDNATDVFVTSDGVVRIPVIDAGEDCIVCDNPPPSDITEKSLANLIWSNGDRSDAIRFMVDSVHDRTIRYSIPYERPLFDRQADALTRHEYRVPSEIPEALNEVGSRLFEFNATATVTRYVYFLSFENSVVYVGQTGCLEARISQHRCEREKVFDSIFFIICPAQRSNSIESYWIARLNPKYNRK